ncbi:MAG: TetR/AcrR family transcriptional regulator [Ignavibacteriaceae bacterium]|nr:TetR/AcrR family transcriptional regulator [Ignavibacteriaceae bacterium]
MSEQISNEKVKAILQAARKRFAHYGFSKVTMDEIAGDVELGKASLYYYFPTKEELFKSVIFQEQTEFIKRIELLLQNSFTATEKLNEYVEQRLMFSRELSNLGTLSAHSVFDFKAVFRKLYDDFELQEVNLIKNIIDEGKNTGEFISDLPEEYPKVFLHVIHGLKLRFIRHLKEQLMEEEIYKELESEMKIVVVVLINGMKNK